MLSVDGYISCRQCVKGPRRVGLLRTGLVQESFIHLKWTLEEESDLTNWKEKCLGGSE